MYVLEKITYGDFDIAQTTPILVSDNHDRLLARVDEFNSSLTDNEVENGIRYRIAPYKVTVI